MAKQHFQLRKHLGGFMKTLQWRLLTGQSDKTSQVSQSKSLQDYFRFSIYLDLFFFLGLEKLVLRRHILSSGPQAGPDPLT
jgi:hypothetical protein